MAIPKAPTTDFTTTTLNGAVNDSVTSIVVNDASSIQYPSYAVIDREDNNGNATATLREVVKITNVSSNTLTVERGANNSTARSHNDSALLEPNMTVGMWDDLYDTLDVEHTPADGTHDATKVMMLAGAQTATGAKTFTTGLLKAVDITSGAGVSTLPTSSDTLVGRATTDTLTNKRITKRVTTDTTSATPTPAGDTSDMYTVTALGEAATFGAPTGTPTNGQTLVIRIEDDGTARALDFNAIYRFSTDLTKPTTTVLGKVLYLGFMYNSTDSKWDCLAKLNNF
jgi:hypothetical protein